MIYNIIATGSGGNCTIVNGCIAIDMGVSWRVIEPYARDLALVLLTHEHSDHFNTRTVKRLAKERPGLRWACREWMIQKLLDAGVRMQNIDAASIGEFFYPGLSLHVRAERVPHNVPNCCWHIASGNERLFYATDAGNLDGIEAKGYDVYLLEANHGEAEIQREIEAAKASGIFTYRERAAENHLSREQAEEWLKKNQGPDSVWIPMHEHKEERHEHA